MRLEGQAFGEFKAAYPLWAIWLSRYLGKKVPYPKVGEHTLRPLRDESGPRPEGVALPPRTLGVAVYKPSFAEKAYLILPPERPYPKGALYLEAPYLLKGGEKVLLEPAPPPVAYTRTLTPFARVVGELGPDELVLVPPEAF